MKNLKLAEVVEQNIDYVSLKAEMLLIQEEILKDASKQRRVFLGSFKIILYSMAVYAGIVLLAWLKYHK